MRYAASRYTVLPLLLVVVLFGGLAGTIGAESAGADLSRIDLPTPQNHGSSGPLAPFRLDGHDPDGRHGYSVSSAGDVNGDGHSDLLVGIPYYGNLQSGRVQLHYGFSGGFLTTPEWVTDGPVIYSEFGYSVSTAGDVNGDGFDDFIVGAPKGDHERGQVFLYLGSASVPSQIPSWTTEGSDIRARFGHSVSTAGDVNGDGYDDVIIGAPHHHRDSRHGQAVVFFGSATGLSLTADWGENGDERDVRLGYSVGGAGDVNGDGYDDIIIGLPYFGGDLGPSQGRVEVYLGSASGPEGDEAWSFEGVVPRSYLGVSVGTAGDVNQDTFADVIVGARGENSYSVPGVAYVFHGSTAGLSWAPAWTVVSDQVSAYYGYSVSTAGDVDGDGYDDVAVGAYQYAIGFPGNTDRSGAAFVYRGSSAGLDPVPVWVGSSSPDSGFGHSVAALGDVDQDGADDIAVGAPYFELGDVSVGRVVAYFGPLTCMDLDEDDACPPEDCDDTNPNCLADCTDADGDGYCIDHDCDETNPYCNTNCQDFDGDDYCVTIDCDDLNSDCTDDCDDADEDGIRICDGDCDDSTPYCQLECRNQDGDAYCFDFDCDDANPNCTSDCTDVDADGFCVTSDCDDTAPGCTAVCDDVDEDGVWACDGDCDDTNPHCLRNCTNVDGDDYCFDLDCNDTNPNCTSDCTDADGDSYCVTTDCADDLPTCNVDCSDGDWDLIPACAFDCDDGRQYCGADCTDLDGDGVCMEYDCNDQDPNCSLRCGGSNSDGDPLSDVCDNCPFVTNPEQVDIDLDGVGDLCDICPEDPLYGLLDRAALFWFYPPGGAEHLSVGPSGNVYFGFRTYAGAWTGDGVFLANIIFDEPQSGDLLDFAVGPNDQLYLAKDYSWPYGSDAFATSGDLAFEFLAGKVVDVDDDGYTYTTLFWYLPDGDSFWEISKWHPSGLPYYANSGSYEYHDRPIAICASNDGFAYVVLKPLRFPWETIPAEINVYDPQMQWAGRIVLDPEFDPVDCVVDTHGYVYVADSAVPRIQVFDRSRDFAVELDAPPFSDSEIVDMSIGPDDRLWIMHDWPIVVVYSPLVLNWDYDGVPVCDNCPDIGNTGQSDFDLDGEGDACDLDDSLIHVRFEQTSRVDWQPEQGFDSWNCYRGDLAELKSGGDYTQAPGSNPAARRECGLLETWMDDQPSPDPEQEAFYLTTGVSGGVEGGLGSDSTGVPRPNANPCP